MDNTERMCELCEECLYDGSVNTGPHNLCEGAMCEEAEVLLEEELEEERINKREDKINTLLDE